MTELLAHDVAGTGSAVLLLHSGVANREMWQPQWDALAARHRVIRCDFRAYGETPVPTSSWSDVDDVLALLDHLGVQTAAVVGSSYGGAVALELASVAPQRVSQLVLLCPAGDVEATADIEEFARAERELVAAGDLEGATALNVRTWLGPEASDEAREQVTGWQRHTFAVQSDAPDDIGPQHVDVDPTQVAVPTTVVTSGHDLDYMRAVAHDLSARQPDARLVELPWAGHLPSLERPDEVTDLLLAELAD